MGARASSRHCQPLPQSGASTLGAIIHALLASWCLMLPPHFADAGKPLDVHAPMSSWVCFREYDSALDCQTVKKTKGNVYYEPGVYVYPVPFGAARCVSKNDPRLKSK
jgi:hypothetical protein